MLGTTGRDASERWENKSKLLQQCVDIYEKATGTTVPGPDEVEAGTATARPRSSTSRSPTSAAS